MVLQACSTSMSENHVAPFRLPIRANYHCEHSPCVKASRCLATVEKR